LAAQWTASLIRCITVLILLASPAWFVPSLHAQSASEYTKKDSKKLLPKALKGTWFGMARTDYAERGGSTMLVAKEAGFRYTYQEVHNDKDGLKTATLYFDGDGDEVLYEVILEYENELARDAAVFALFGSPNTGEREWWFPTDHAFPVRVWLHEKKLVIAAVLPGTAWEGEWN
jgi:hypothetical protein